MIVGVPERDTGTADVHMQSADSGSRESRRIPSLPGRRRSGAAGKMQTLSTSIRDRFHFPADNLDRTDLRFRKRRLPVARTTVVRGHPATVARAMLGP